MEEESQVSDKLYYQKKDVFKERIRMLIFDTKTSNILIT